MAAMTYINNSINCCESTACASNLVLPIIDAAIILVVSILVCLRITMLGM